MCARTSVSALLRILALMGGHRSYLAGLCGPAATAVVGCEGISSTLGIKPV
jgi:hypothetical protein